MDQMTPAATGAVVRYLGSLFPRWKTTPELITVWADVFRRYEEPIVRRVIAEHRQVRRGDDPSLPDIKEALAAANPPMQRLPERTHGNDDLNDVGGWLGYFYGHPKGRAELEGMPDCARRGLDWMREIWGLDENGQPVAQTTKIQWRTRRMQALRKVAGQ